MSGTLSVALLTYNHEDTIKDCLEMILNQTYQDFFLCIFDDASSDGTLEVLREYKKKFPKKIELISNLSNLGAMGNFKKALHFIHECGRGTYFHWACPDDKIERDYFEKCIAALSSNQSSVVAQSFINIFYKQDLNIKVSKPISLFPENNGLIAYQSTYLGIFQPYNQVIHGIMYFDYVEKIFPFRTFFFEEVLLCELSIISLMQAYGGVTIIPEILCTKTIEGRFEDRHPSDSLTKMRQSQRTMFVSCVKILCLYLIYGPQKKRQLLVSWTQLFNEYFFYRFKSSLKTMVKSFLHLFLNRNQGLI